MRHRIGNPFRDQHGPAWRMHVYDFVGRATDPHSVSQCIEFVVPELCVFGRGTVLKERIWLEKEHRFIEQTVHMQDYDPLKQGWINGAVWTSWEHDLIRDEPCLYIALGLYDMACKDTMGCIAGHKGFEIKKAPALAQWSIDAIKEEIGEHPRLRLGVRPDLDENVCRELTIKQVGPAVLVR